MVKKIDANRHHPYATYTYTVNRIEAVKLCYYLNHESYHKWLNDTTTVRASGIRVTPISKFRHHWNAFKKKLTCLIKYQPTPHDIPPEIAANRQHGDRHY